MTSQARRSGWLWLIARPVPRDRATRPRRHRHVTYQVSLHQKLIIKLTASTDDRQPESRAEPWSRDQGRPVSCGTAWGSQDSFQADPDQAGAAAAIPALTASASPGARPVGHETPNAVEHMGQACLELLLPLILGEAGRQAVQRRKRLASISSAGSMSSRGLPASAIAARCSGERAGLSPPGTGLAAATRPGELNSPDAVSVLAKDPSPGFGSRSAMALDSRAGNRGGNR